MPGSKRYNIVERSGLDQSLGWGLKTASPRSWEIWMLIAGFTHWCVWKARGLKVFQDLVHPPEEFIMDIWFTIIGCLRGQLDEVCSHFANVVIACLCFWQKWSNTSMVTRGGTTSPHVSHWLFPTHLPSFHRWRPEDPSRAGWRWISLVYSSRYLFTLSRKYERIDM